MPGKRKRKLAYGIARLVRPVVVAYHDLYLSKEGSGGKLEYDVRSTVAGQFEVAPGMEDPPGAFGFTSARARSTARASNWPPDLK